MDEDPGLSEGYHMASPWPVFIAVGLAISEVGILFDLFVVAVGGLMLLCGSIAGMATEAGYAKTPWRALGVCAVALLGLGGALLYAAGAAPPAVEIGQRGQAVLATAAVLLVGAVGGELLDDGGEEFPN